MCTRYRLVALLLCVTAGHIVCQSAPEDRKGGLTALSQRTWVDPATGLMWAGKDNGQDVNWTQAMKSCRNLRLSGYRDWRLGTIQELESIYDKAINTPGWSPHGAATWHVKGDLYLSANQWSSTKATEDRGRMSRYAYRFDFNEGRAVDDDELSFRSAKRALCVRDQKE